MLIALLVLAPVLGWLGGRIVGNTPTNTSWKRKAQQPEGRTWVPAVAEMAGMLTIIGVALGCHFGGVPDWRMASWVWLAWLTVVFTGTDLTCRRLPDKLMLPAMPISVVLLVAACLEADAFDQVSLMLAGGLGLFAAYGLVWFVNPKALGFGDVKLALILGAYLASIDYGAIPVAVLISGLVFAIAGVVVAKVTKTKFTKVRLPYGPAMLAGTWLGFLVGPWAWQSLIAAVAL